MQQMYKQVVEKPVEVITRNCFYYKCHFLILNTKCFDQNF